MAGGWISQAEFDAGLVSLGCTSTPRQHERWRNEGLLLPRPRQRPNYRGSIVEHPATAVRQVRAIERALDVKRDFKEAGAVLWAAGFEVDDRYWREQLEGADRVTRRITDICLKFIRRDRDEMTLGERAVARGGSTGILAKWARRLDEPQLARLMNLGIEVLTGAFERFEPPASDRDEFTSEDVALIAFDFPSAEGDRIFEDPLHLAPGLGQVLSDYSGVTSKTNLQDLSDSEIRSARDDVRNTLKMAYCLHDALAWIYGPQAFGLRTAAYIARTMSMPVIFQITLGFARLRQQSNSLLSSLEIAALADRAEAIWLTANYFRDLQTTHPEMRKLIGPKRLKRAFWDSQEYEKLLEELAGYTFPKPDFRPWEQWRKSSKTMSPGLLAMSIGTPSRRSLDDIIRREDAEPNHSFSAGMASL